MPKMSKKEFEDTSFGLRLVLAERWRQVSEMGLTSWHDQCLYKNNELLKAARCYLQNALEPESSTEVPAMWPWNNLFFGKGSWRPSSHLGDEGRIRDIVKAGALLVAEHDRRCDNYRAFTGEAFDRKDATAFSGFNREDNDPDYMARCWIKNGIESVDLILADLAEKRTHPGETGLSESKLNLQILVAALHASAAIEELIRKLGDKTSFTVPDKAVEPVDAILASYQQVAKVRINGWMVNVFKPSSMEQLPVYKMRECLEMILIYDVHAAEVTHKKYFKHNPDYGAWDAKTLSTYDLKKKEANVYFCSIVVRPFSKEASRLYSRDWPVDVTKRAERVFDSRVYDRENGYEAAYTFSTPEDGEKMMIRMKDGDVVEGDGLKG